MMHTVGKFNFSFRHRCRHLIHLFTSDAIGTSIQIINPVSKSPPSWHTHASDIRENQCKSVISARQQNVAWCVPGKVGCGILVLPLGRAWTSAHKKAFFPQFQRWQQSMAWNLTMFWVGTGTNSILWRLSASCVFAYVLAHIFSICTWRMSVLKLFFSARHKSVLKLHDMASVQSLGHNNNDLVSECLYSQDHGSHDASAMHQREAYTSRHWLAVRVWKKEKRQVFK